jgi:integrase
LALVRTQRTRARIGITPIVRVPNLRVVSWTDRQAARAAIDAADQKARALCLIQTGSSERRPLDFHSFRRAFNTALADAGVNVQAAMRLAGHRSADTHMRYVLIAEVLHTPLAAMPKFEKAPAVPFARPPRAEMMCLPARPSRRV